MFNVLNDYTERLYPHIEEQRKASDQLKQQQEQLQQTLVVGGISNCQSAEQQEGDGQQDQVEGDKEVEQEVVKEIVDDTENEVEKSMQEEEKHEEIKKPKSMDQLIAEEIQDLKKDEKFYVFDLKMPSLIFIKISLPYKDLIDVGDLGNAIVKDIMENKKTLTRFCLRFLPIMCV